MEFDVVIIGGGITGLMSAVKLSNLGLHVALIEQSSTFAFGPSTRNEGWLHRGTYHASSIRDRNAALQVARRCIYGHEQLRGFAPEAIEETGDYPYALLREADHQAELESRWDEAGVLYRSVSKSRVQQIFPDADLSCVERSYEVRDVSINTRLLYRKLTALARRAGCSFFLGSEILSIEANDLVLRDPKGALVRLAGRKFIYAAGAGTKEIFAYHHGLHLPIRYWKSHLVVTNRFGPAGLFFVDPHEAAMMQHGSASIVGMNEDATLLDEPSSTVIPEKARNLHRAIQRLFPRWDGAASQNIACVKVDLATNPTDARSLAIAVVEPVPDHICVLPGKMTEAPYLTDILTAHLHEWLDDPSISMRPCDLFLSNQQFAA